MPSLKCALRSAPRGSRSASMRALSRRTSRTWVASSPSAGQRMGSMRAVKRSPSPGSPATGRARSRAWASQVSDQRS